MRASIILRRDVQGRVAVTHYQDPAEAKTKFKLDSVPGDVELWTSGRGRVRRKINKAVAAPAAAVPLAAPKPVTQQPAKGKG